MFDELLILVDKLDSIAQQIQNSDHISDIDRSNLVKQLNDEYREWYTSCLSILPFDIHDLFKFEFYGDLPSKPKIRSYLENSLDTHPLYMVGKESSAFPKWLYAYSKTFYYPLLQQKTLLIEAKKRPGLLIAGTHSKVFNDPSHEAKYRHDLFVLMPFLTKMRAIYSDHIGNVARRMGLTLARGDDFFTTESVMQDVWNAIHGAQLIIADCTGRNPNVFYELGIAQTIRKPTIMITSNEEDIPFDLRHQRYIIYEYTPPGMEQFELKLQDAIEKLKLK